MGSNSLKFQTKILESTRGSIRNNEETPNKTKKAMNRSIEVAPVKLEPIIENNANELDQVVYHEMRQSYQKVNESSEKTKVQFNGRKSPAMQTINNIRFASIE